MKLNSLVKTIGIFRAKAPRKTQSKDSQRAEQKWRLSQYIEAGAEFPYLCATGDKQGDGLWVCHCRHENQLVHYAGPRPFNYLRCGKCEHILCESCPTSAILTPLKQVTSESLIPRGREPTSFCWVCQHCGLSHRATISQSASQCECGHSLKDCSQGYLIGSIVEYRRDPEGTAVTLSLQRRHTAAQLETTELAPKPTYVNYSRPYRVQERVLARASSEPEIRAAPPMSRPHTFPRAATSSSPYRPPDESDENLSNEELAWYEDLLG
jgi:hypothetical protein